MATVQVLLQCAGVAMLGGSATGLAVSRLRSTASLVVAIVAFSLLLAATVLGGAR
jgi:hypothetical protein